MDFSLSPKARAACSRVEAFVEERLLPIEAQLLEASRAMGSGWRSWRVPEALERVRAEARAEGLWNLFLPDTGLKLSTLEYAPCAEVMGRSVWGAEVFNCNAPDSGNMEVLWKYGSSFQKERWLGPMLEGRMRSVFCMTEPQVASSDATNMAATARVEGDQVVLNGRKWWSTGLGHPDCRVALFMGVTSPEADRHHQHSIVLCPLDAPGIRVERMLPVLGEYDAPSGHGEITFEQVKVPLDHVIGGLGQGFEIAQGRLGPGRIHHAMRCIGAAERGLDLLVQRGLARVAFGKPLIHLGGNRERVAELRVAIDQARLLTWYAAWKLDAEGALGAMKEISAIKLVAPNVLQRVADEAIQMFGGAGLSQDVPLTALLALGRVLRIADGPDAVHRGLIAKLELMKHAGRVA